MKEFDPNLRVDGGIILPGEGRTTTLDNPIAHEQSLQMEIERMERESRSGKKANLNYILPKR